MRITLTAVICALLFAVTTACQEIQWREITIESTHAGMEVSRDLRLVVESHNGLIISRKQRVNPQLVNNLVDSLTSQVLPAPTPSNLGMTDGWLKQNVPTALEGPLTRKFCSK